MSRNIDVQQSDGCLAGQPCPRLSMAHAAVTKACPGAFRPGGQPGGLD